MSVCDVVRLHMIINKLANPPDRSRRIAIFLVSRRMAAAVVAQRAWRSHYRWKWFMRDIRLREQASVASSSYILCCESFSLSAVAGSETKLEIMLYLLPLFDNYHLCLHPVCFLLKAYYVCVQCNYAC